MSRTGENIYKRKDGRWEARYIKYYDGNGKAIAARRRALAEALRQGEPVVVTPSGEVGQKDEMQDNGLSGIEVPQGKLAKED